jgi:Tol biopolymer transport system component
VLDTTTGKEKHLVGGELGCLAPFDLDWSSDGTRLVYACDEYPEWRIYVIEPDGSDRMLLKTGLPGPLSSPSWSLDGTRIVFERRSGGQSEIYLFDLLASRRTLLVRGGTAPAWSPDGTTIAYRVGCGVRLATPAGRDVTPISGPDRCQAIGVPGVPVWSPDGKKIAVGTKNGGIYVMQADGSHLSRISTKDAAGATGLGRPCRVRKSIRWLEAARS